MRRRRDRGNELIVAIAVTGVLVVALAFAIILTLSSNADDDGDDDTDRTPTGESVAGLPPTVEVTESSTETGTEISTEMGTESATDAGLGTETSTEVTAPPTDAIETEEAAATPEASETPQPSETPSPEPSDTPEPTATHTREPAAGLGEAATEENDGTAIAQAAPPTREPSATATEAPSETPQPSETPVPPSPTSEPSDTPEPTATPSVTPSPTPTERPTATPSPTRTPSRTPTFTPSYTPTLSATLTFTPYPSLTPSITPFGGERTNTPSASGCAVPDNWIPYSIQRGDTLSSLALRFGLPLTELAEANCIINIQSITAGQILFVPPGSNVTPPAPSTALPGGDVQPAEPISFDCGDPSARITQPLAGTVLQGTFAVYGTAAGPNFQFYRLQISGGNPVDTEFVTLSDVYRTPVENGQLGIINTAAFAPGDYWLRLTVVDNTGNYPPQCTVRVRFAP